MALMTTAEVKTFLRETSTTYDSLIAIYIPIIEEDICEYLNNWFEDKVIYLDGTGNFEFTSATATDSPDAVTDDNEDFSTAGFKSGMDVAIRGGSNYGIYNITALSSAKMTLNTTSAFVGQDQNESYHSVGRIRISRIHWPDALKPIAAKMIWSQIADAKPGNASQERIDDYSVTYINGHMYPTRVIRGLDHWKHARMQ